MPREVGKKGIMMNSIRSEMNVGNDTLQHVRKACKRSIESRADAKGGHEGEETDLERPTKRRVKQPTENPLTIGPHWFKSIL